MSRNQLERLNQSIVDKTSQVEKARAAALKSETNPTNLVNRTIQRPSILMNASLATLMLFAVMAERVSASQGQTTNAESTTNAAKAEPVADCAPLNEVEIVKVNECVGPGKAGVYLTAEVFENKNNKPGYQSEDGDKIERKFTEAEYLVTNTADRRQFYNARVNQFGELYYEQEDKDGKVHQVRVFVFSGEANSKDKYERPALRIEVRNKNAYDKDLNRVVELGDPRYHDTALECTPLPVYLWKDKSYLTPPGVVETPPTPPRVTETPPAPYQIPPVQVPARAPVQVPSK